MRRSIVFLTISLALLFGFNFDLFGQSKVQHETVIQTQEKDTKKPDLPDFNKASYYELLKDVVGSILHPDLGELFGTLYVDNEDVQKAHNGVMVFRTKDLKKIYLEWAYFNEDFTERILRGYNLKDDKWVFDKEEVKVVKK